MFIYIGAFSKIGADSPNEYIIFICVYMFIYRGVFKNRGGFKAPLRVSKRP
jgi:hypothetical protein